MSLAMAFDDPARLDLGALFRNEGMFDSRRAWSNAGFRVIERSNDGKVMVARHPSVQGLMFKKYTSDVGEKDQTKNFQRRLDGANQLREFAGSRRLSRIVVPHKWLLALPRPFPREAHVLVVEQLDLLSDSQTKAAYRRIDPSVLAELCAVLFKYRGMDSIAKNLPFVSDGRIGLIDTEHWDRRALDRCPASRCTNSNGLAAEANLTLGVATAEIGRCGNTAAAQGFVDFALQLRRRLFLCGVMPAWRRLFRLPEDAFIISLEYKGDVCNDRIAALVDLDTIGIVLVAEALHQNTPSPQNSDCLLKMAFLKIHWALSSDLRRSRSRDSMSHGHST